MALVDSIQNIFRIPELRRRLLFTLGMLAIYRLGEHIPAPGVNGQALAAMFAAAACVMTAPFGRPEVPDVYWTSTGDDGSSAITVSGSPLCASCTNPSSGASWAGRGIRSTTARRRAPTACPHQRARIVLLASLLAWRLTTRP